jgi:SagB-type dehydrogenase family enzyme
MPHDIFAMTPDLFLRVIDGRLVLWNYITHEQFEIDHEHLDALIALSKGDTLPIGAIEDDLRSGGCMDHVEPKTWGWDCLARIFHFGTQIRLAPGEPLPENDHTEGYLSYCSSIAANAPQLATELSGRTQALPVPDWKDLEEISLASALKNRKTCREFYKREISISQLSTALWVTFGAIHGINEAEYKEAGLETVGFRRSSPSGGALQPSEPYLLAMNVKGLESGIYHYRSHSHELSLISDSFDPEKLGGLLCGQYCASELAYGVFVTSRFDKLWWKYPHSRSYRVALIDVGCLAQTFQLVCCSQHLRSWITGYFFDCEINQILGLNQDRESVMFFLGAGHGAGSIGWDARRAAAKMGKSL